MNRGEVYWIEFGPGEVQKLRPAVVLTSDQALPHLNRVHVELAFDCAPGDWNVVAGERSDVFVMCSSPIEAAAAIERTCLSR